MSGERGGGVATDAVSALRRRLLGFGLMIVTSFLDGVRAAPPARKRVELSIATDGDLLAFKPDHLSCVTGALVHLTFYNAGKYISQEHNFVLVAPGAAEAVDEEALAAGEQNGWVPRNDPRVLAATAQCGKGQHVSVAFVAPAPGRYPFLCTNPGHGAVMHGILDVTPS